VSSVSSTATYSNIQTECGNTGSTGSHLIYSNIGNHTNNEIGNTYSNVGTFSAASSIGKFCCYDVFEYTVRLYKWGLNETCTGVITRDLAGPVTHCTQALRQIPLSGQAIYVMLVEFHSNQ